MEGLGQALRRLDAALGVVDEEAERGPAAFVVLEPRLPALQAPRARMQATVAARSETGRHDLANLMSDLQGLRPLAQSGASDVGEERPVGVLRWQRQDAVQLGLEVLAPSTRPGGARASTSRLDGASRNALEPGCRLRLRRWPRRSPRRRRRPAARCASWSRTSRTVAWAGSGRSTRRVGHLPCVGAVADAHRLGSPGDVHRRGGADRDDDPQPEPAVRRVARRPRRRRRACGGAPRPTVRSRAGAGRTSSSR